MRIFCFAAALTLALGTAAPAATTIIVMPSQVHWVAGTGPQTGAKVAVLAGNPDKPGPYTMRLWLPAGAKFGPHWHGDVENVTVISGTILVGLGDKVNPAKMIALGPGSFAQIPIGVHHYAWAKTDAVIQIHGVGPSSMTMVKM